ncbi:hypothetical protein HBI81_245990 [Parastagonospora nodorum]|nr:hypothetical protein HBH52_074090 [Parastagonospora nodorum]KAH4082856.1 hypothetical protein HBH46_219970 [Parastagonospora nodorum]KAH5483766.1 hypothetical protein HBI31_174210 [Parastagonospora nodorum]KAH5711452.1 hypothetical protein HBI18_219810 [Parastagonospora nodorum]KAH5728873.1 hypothetical protein HBI17_225490 [Parastagonospora nodorum]
MPLRSAAQIKKRSAEKFVVDLVSSSPPAKRSRRSRRTVVEIESDDNLEEVAVGKHVNVSKDTSGSDDKVTVVDRDWIDEPDFYCPSLLQEAVDVDLVSDEEVEVGPRDLQIPKKFRIRKNDTTRCGSFETIRVNTTTKADRMALVTGRVRDIVKCLKDLVASEAWFVPEDVNPLNCFTKGFVALIKKESVDSMTEAILRGVPDSTMSILGKEGFAVEDLLSLPRWSDQRLTEHGVYLDVLKYAPGERYQWNLYVGSGTGGFGILQRWSNYFHGMDKTRHGKATKVAGREMNLRGLAHFGFEPKPWLPILTEGVFMLYLGTISDPGFREEKFNRFISDELYCIVKKLRMECKLDERVARGLNSTWTFAQGWVGVAIKSGAKCVNCSREVPDKKDPTWDRHDWRHADPVNPKPDAVKCANCVIYVHKWGIERPKEYELSRPSHAPKSLSRWEKTDLCEHATCASPAELWNGVADMWVCKLHGWRAYQGIDMDLEARKPDPGHCEWEECDRTSFAFHKETDKFYCTAHIQRVRNGLDMSKEIMTMTRTNAPSDTPKPTECQQEGCDRTDIEFYGARNEYYCAAHSQRARTIDRTGKGTPMEAPLKKSKTAKRPSGPPPTTCQWEQCDRPYYGWVGKSGKSGKHLCQTHHSRAVKDMKMNAPMPPVGAGKTKAMRVAKKKAEEKNSSK